MKLSQNQKVLNYLKKHDYITPLVAFAVLGVFRLAARVYDLRSQGFDIQSVTMMDDEGRPYCRYSLVS